MVIENDVNWQTPGQPAAAAVVVEDDDEPNAHESSGETPVIRTVETVETEKKEKTPAAAAFLVEHDEQEQLEEQAISETEPALLHTISNEEDVVVVAVATTAAADCAVEDTAPEKMAVATTEGSALPHSLLQDVVARDIADNNQDAAANLVTTIETLDRNDGAVTESLTDPAVATTDALGPSAGDTVASVAARNDSDDSNIADGCADPIPDIPRPESLISFSSQTSATESSPTLVTSPPNSLEECLYGNEMSRLQQQQQQTSRPTSPKDADYNDDDDNRRFVLHDDMDMLRPLGLWKTSRHSISMVALRKIASQTGIPDEGSHRAVAWRVLLGYLPTDCSLWERTLQEKRAFYRSFIHDWFHNVPDCDDGDALRWKRKVPNRAMRPAASSGFGALDHTTTNTSDHSSSSSSHNNLPEGSMSSTSSLDQAAAAVTTLDSSVDARWDSSSNSDIFMQGQLVDDQGGLSTIPSPIKAQWNERSGMANSAVLENLMRRNMNKLQLKDLLHVSSHSQTDSNRTTQDDAVGDACFRDVAESAKLLDEIRKDVVRTFPDLSFFLDPDDNVGKRRYAAMERILFAWSKYNKGVRYVQGMNEIVGTIYYVLANDWNEEWASEAEADTYWLFHILLLDMRDVFCPDLDEADTGIQGRIETVEKLLQRHDPQVKEHLVEIGVECSFFAIRWWTTLLSREFLLPDTIRLWDSMFASTHKDNFLCYVCVTMVTLIRDDLLKGDFSSCLRLLQSYPPVLMDQLLHSSRALWVYERQITVACLKGGISLHQALQAVPPPNSVIMAFGFRSGVVPRTRAELLEDAGERAAEAVREATAAVAVKASGWLGRASRLVRRYRSQSSESLQSAISSAKSSEQSKHDAADAASDHDEVDSIYMAAIENATAGQWSYSANKT